MNKSILKRTLSIVLTMALVITSINFGGVNSVNAEEKEKETYTYGELIAADSMYNAEPETTLSDITKAMLLNDALKSKKVEVCVPDNATEEQIVVSGQSITALNYDAEYEGRRWFPSAFNVLKNGEIVDTGIFNEDGKGTFTATEHDYIEVQYMLGLTDAFQEEVLELLNTPYSLVEEAKAQKDVLTKLSDSTVSDTLGSISQTLLNFVKADLGTDAKAAVGVLMNEAFNKQTGDLFLYEYITNYKWDGLAYYYAESNSENMKEQTELLADQFAVILTDSALSTALENVGCGELKDKLVTVTDILNDVQEGLSAPNKAIDGESAKLDSLVSLIEKAIETEGSVKEYTKNWGVSAYYVLEEVPAGYSLLTITSERLDSAGNVVAAKSRKTIVATGGTVSGHYVNLSLANLDEKLFEDRNEYYQCSSSDSFVFTDGDEIPVNWDMTITRTIEPMGNRVTDSEGTMIGNVYFDNKELQLPASDVYTAYEFYINGEKIEVPADGKYELTDAQFEALRNREFELVVKEIKVAYENALALIESLNGILGENGAAFIPVDVNGQLQVVLRLPAVDSKAALDDCMTAISKALLTSDFSYVGIANHVVNNAGIVSDQALVDTIIGIDGLSTQKVLDVIDENGSINEMTITGGAVLTGSATNVSSPALYGGEVSCSSLQLAVGEEAVPYEIPLHITIEDFDAHTEYLKSLRAGVEKLVNYVTIERGCNHADKEDACGDNQITVTVISSENEDAVLLGKMLVSSSAVEALTSQSISATLKKLGFDEAEVAKDSALVKYLEGVRDFLNSDTGVVDCKLELQGLTQKPSESPKPTEGPTQEPSESPKPTEGPTQEPSESPVPTEGPTETPDVSGGSINIDPITGKTYGDSNLDGKISLEDAQLALVVALGIKTVDADTERIIVGGADVRASLEHAQIILKLALGIQNTYYVEETEN